MTPFDLEAAKRGEPVQTRDGRKVRIVCFDVKSKNYPILAIIENNDGTEIPVSMTNEGVHVYGCPESTTLIMAPRTVTRWRVIYRDGDNAAQRDFDSEGKARFFWDNNRGQAFLPFPIEVTL